MQRNSFAQKDGFNANIEPEKVHDLIPEAYRHASNSADNYPGIRTAFYAQQDPEYNREMMRL
jgi:hypothetical protein